MCCHWISPKVGKVKQVHHFYYDCNGTRFNLVSKYTIELGHSISYKTAFATSENPDQPAHADQSFRCPPEDALDPWLPTEYSAKILIGLRECAGWSETSLGAYTRM